MKFYTVLKRLWIILTLLAMIQLRYDAACAFALLAIYNAIEDWRANSK